MTSQLPTPGVDDGDTPTRFGDHGSHERQARSYTQKRVARLTRLARICIRDQEMDSPKSPRSLMPATAIADRLPIEDRDRFWEALKGSIRRGAFDPSSDEKAPLRVFNDSPPLRLTSDLLIELTADDGIDGLGDEKPIFEEGYLKKTWARIDTWARWCRGTRFEVPESWRRKTEAHVQSRTRPPFNEGQTSEQGLRPVDEQEAQAILRAHVDRLNQNNGSQILAEQGVQYRPSDNPGSLDLRALARQIKPRKRGRPTKQ